MNTATCTIRKIFGFAIFAFIMVSLFSILSIDVYTYRRLENDNRKSEFDFMSEARSAGTVKARLEPVDNETFPHEYQLLYYRVTIYHDELSSLLNVTYARLCLTWLETEVQYNSFKELYYTKSEHSHQLQRDQPLCDYYIPQSKNVFDIDLIQDFENVSQPVKFDFGELDSLYHYYPFDIIEFRPIIGFQAMIYEKNGTQIADIFVPATLILDKTPNYSRIAYEITPSSETIILSRPTGLRIIISSIIISLALSVSAIVLIESLGTLMEVAVALLLGMWITRQSFLPNIPESLIALDIIFFILYLALFLPIVIAIITNLGYASQKELKNKMTYSYLLERRYKDYSEEKIEEDDNGYI